MNSRLKKEAAEFNKIVNLRKNKNISSDLKNKKTNYYFFNNPWRYNDTRQIGIKNKINFVINNIRKNSKVLDVGCGTGTLSIELARANINCTGIDISAKSLNIAKDLAKNNLTNKQTKLINFLKISLKEFSKSNEKYDAVIFFKTLHHLEKINEVTKIVKNLLNKNGKIIIVEPVRNDLTNLNIIFAYIIRTLSDTWINKIKKISLAEKDINKEIFRLFKEYKYISSKKGYDQSPMDNTIGSSELIINSIKKNFKIKKILFKDAFMDKIIGGIRGPLRKPQVKFIELIDDYLIKKKIIPGLSLLLTAEKK